MDRADEASLKELIKLWQICSAFIEKHQITCVEAISQQDSIIVDGYDLIASICEEVGYYENDIFEDE